MADFVAVIRRAVDGLAKNTPDMRAKVYDKARGAVRRQLENMKPTPSEDLIRRQMDKLESAIDSVEAEHAEALPAEEPVAAPVSVAPEVSEQETPSPEAPEAAEPETMAPGWLHDRPAAAHATVEDDYREPVAEPSVPQEEHVSGPAEEQAAEPVHMAYDDHAAPVEPDHEQAWEPEQPPAEEPLQDELAEHAGHGETPRPETTAADHAADWPEAEAYQPSQDIPYDSDAANAVEHRREDVDQVPAPQEQDVPVEGVQSWHPEEQQPLPSDAADASAAGDWAWPPEEPVSTDAEAAWQDVPDLGAHQPEPVEPVYPQSPAEPVEARFDDQTHVSADSVRMPPVADLPDLAPAAAVDYRADAADEFGGVHRAAVNAEQPQPASRETDPWSDLEELIGYNRDALPASATPANAEDADGEMLAPPPPTYRVAPKKRSYAGPILALIGLLIVAGGGYALWMNRDSLTDLVDISEPVAPATTPEGEGEAADAPPPAATQQTPPAGTDTPEGEAAAPATEDGVATDAKFTQRLLPNGTEVDEGPGPTGATGEGQSVAQLNAPAAAAGEANAAEAGAAEEAPAEPSATPSDAAALSGEKMFLYEERLGQTAPTAIEGAVSWSVQREPGENGAQEPVVQGRLNVPGRGLTALLTFKRNTDASLPASHLVEIVFAVPPGFEGGAIDSVQRIAMKQTEQDRGDALIAVPAKITDDFHMIALNDFPDARATNLELLRSREWMDIPLAYRNGRRALLTIQKGAAGTQAFNEAIQEWATLGGGNNAAPPPTGQ